MREIERDCVPGVALICLRAMLQFRVDGSFRKADDGREGSSKKDWPPQGADESGHDDDSACPVHLGFGNGTVQQGHRREEIAEGRMSDSADIAK